MAKVKPQKSLFEGVDNNTSWQNEWVGMPEFVQEDLTSFRKIIVHFECQEDVSDFAKLIGQKISPKQPSLWYPQKDPRRYANKRYIDEP